MIILGDCLEEIKKIESNSIDLIITDPPYGISKESFFKNSSDSLPQNLKTKYCSHNIDFGYWDKEDLDLTTLFSEYYRVMKSGATLIFFYDVWKSNLIKLEAEKNKFKQPRVGIWLKTNPVPINSKVNYLSNSKEFFFTFVKDKKPTFNSEYDNGIYTYPLCHGKERLQHPTQKPLNLFIDLIQKHSNVGDVVLDTFSGVGTTAEAAYKTSRKFICIERDEKYFEIMKKRVEEFSLGS